MIERGHVTVCAECRQQAPSNVQACPECGGAVALYCRQCDGLAPLDATSCPGCAAPLRGTIAETDAPLRVPAPIFASAPGHEAGPLSTHPPARRFVTALCIHLVGVSELASRVEPEEFSELRGEFAAAITEAVESLGGMVEQFSGETALAAFGAPQTQEEHPRRACTAALLIAQQFQAMRPELLDMYGVDVRARIGIAIGEAPAPDGSGTSGQGRMDHVTVFDAASRIALMDTREGIYLSEDCASLVRTAFNLQPERRPDPAADGSHRLLGPTGLRTRFQGNLRRGLSPLVGRANELVALGDALDRAQRGHGQAVVVMGEPGIGKSRLCHEFAQRCTEEGTAVLHTQAFAESAVLPFAPVLSLLRAYFEVGPQDAHDVIHVKVATRVRGISSSLEWTCPALLLCLGVSMPGSSLTHLPVEELQRRVCDSIWHLWEADAARRRFVVVVEDAQWLDSSSRVWLDRGLEHLAQSRVLLLLTVRPGFTAHWLDSFVCRRIELEPLGPEERSKHLRDLLGPSPSLGPLIEEVAARTAGNPLFAEELVQALIENKTVVGDPARLHLAESGHSSVLPLTVQAVLEARVARLPSQEQHVLQRAAVVGTEFSEPLLAAIVDVPLVELRRSLATLAEANFIYEVVFGPTPRYAFRHPLSQEVAYLSQSTAAREDLHLAIGERLLETDDADGDRTPGRIAHHLLAAGRRAPADPVLRYAGLAGDEAMALYAVTEAERFYLGALDRLGELPNADPAIRAELEGKLGGVRGYQGDLDAAEAYSRAAIRDFERLGRQLDADRIRVGVARHLMQHALQEQALLYLRPLLDRAQKQDELVYGLALAQYAMAADFAGDSAMMLPLFRRVSNLAGRLNSPHLQRQARRIERGWYQNHTPHLDRARRANEWLVRHAQREGDVWDLCRVQGDLGLDYFLAGRVGQALDVLDAAIEHAVAVGSAVSVVDNAAIRCACFCFQGEWRRLEDEYEFLAPYLPRVQRSLRLGLLVWSRVRRDLWRGTETQEQRSPRENYENMSLTQAAVLASTALAASERDPASAEDRLRAATEWVPAEGDGLLWLIAAQALTAGWANLGRAELAARWYTSLSRYRHSLYLGSTALELGRTAALNGWWRAGLNHLNVAIRAARREGLRPLLGVGLAERAVLYERRGHRGDRARTRQAADEAAAILRRLDMPAWVERCERLGAAR